MNKTERHDGFAEAAYAKYTRALDKLHARYYPVSGAGLVGNRSDYLDKWGAATSAYKAEMRALGYPNYEEKA